MTNNTNTYTPPMPPQGQMMRPAAPRGWRERWIQRFGMDVAAAPLRKGELTIPNWLTGKAIVFFFISMCLCWFIFGHEPAFELILVSIVSLIAFLYGGGVISRSLAHAKEKKFERSVYIAAFSIRLIWVLYCVIIFNPEHFGNTYGDTADVDWYMPFAHDLSQWLTGNTQHSFAEIMKINGSAIDDTGYPLWLAIGYVFWGEWSDAVMPMIIKAIVNAYCAVSIYHVGKRHFGEGVGRMAAIFVAFCPDIIYWCGNMMKEAEMVFVCCIFIDEIDKALSANKLGFKALLPGLLAGFYLFFFRAALGVACFVAVFAHVVFVSNRVLPFGKKIIAGILVVITLLIGMGDSLRTKTEKMFETAQENTEQKKNMEWRAEREGGNAFAKYAGEAVFAPLIFTIPFPTFNMAYEKQLRQIQLSGSSYIKNIFSYFVIMVMLMMLVSNEWRRHVFLLAYTVGYLGILVLSNFAQSGRFHIPIFPMLMLFAAYGIQIAKGNARLRRWYSIVLVLEVVACVAWNWFKLAGRGLV